MNGLRLRVPLIFLFTAMILIARPALIFGSSAIQTSLKQEVRVFGLVKAIRKRKERIPIIDVLRNEDRVLIHIAPLSVVLFLLKKWLTRILILIALTFNCQYFIRRRRTVFEIRPYNDYILALSTLQI